MRILVIAILLMSFLACKNESVKEVKEDKVEKKEVRTEQIDMNPIQKQAKIDQDLIEEYVSKKGIEVNSTSSGLHYRVIEEGNKDKMPVKTSKVKVNYKGMLLNGQVFDQSPEGKPISFGLDQVIAGWTEGLQLIGEGGTVQLIIPSRMAYGPRKVSIIPANSVLVFDVDLLEVQ